MTARRNFIVACLAAAALSIGGQVLANAAPAASAGQAVPAAETARIEALIVSLDRLGSARFVRNGKEHSAREAASHLRMKWNKAGKRVRTAEDFILCCAAGSSMSGRKYLIRFADGREQASAEYFRAELRRIDAERAAPAKSGPRPASSPG